MQRKPRLRATCRDYDRYLTPNEIVCKRREAFVFVFGPSIFDLNRLPLDKAVMA